MTPSTPKTPVIPKRDLPALIDAYKNAASIELSRFQISTLIRACAISFLHDQKRCQRAQKARRYVAGKAAGFAASAADSKTLMDALMKIESECWPAPAQPAKEAKHGR